MGDNMKKLILVITLLLISGNAMADAISINTPIIAKHLKKRNHPSGDDHKETFFGKSLGLSYVADNGWGVSGTYVKENSLRNKAYYFTVDYMHTVYKYTPWDLEIKLGGSVGGASGYPKKAKGISKTDSRPWATINSEACKGSHCGSVGFVPAFTTAPTLIFQYKYLIPIK